MLNKSANTEQCTREVKKDFVVEEDANLRHARPHFFSHVTFSQPHLARSKVSPVGGPGSMFNDVHE